MNHRCSNLRTLLTICCSLWLVVATCADETIKSFDSDGVTIAYKVYGEGEPLVLIHGFAGDDDQWASYVEPLTEHFQVITLDCRGHGDSDKPRRSGAYGPDLVDDVIRLLDHLSIARAHIAGYSMGGMITLAAVERYPDRVISAVVGGYGWDEDTNEFERSTRAIARDIEAGRGFRSLMETLLPPNAEIPAMQIDMIDALLMERNDPKALASVLRSFQYLKPDRDALAANRVPTLAVLGEDDVFVDGVRNMDSYMRELEVDIIEQANHMSAFISPRFYSSLERFLVKHMNHRDTARTDASSDETHTVQP